MPVKPVYHDWLTDWLTYLGYITDLISITELQNLHVVFKHLDGKNSVNSEDFSSKS